MVLFTHITIEELAATPAEDRRSRLLLLLIDLGHLIPTAGGFVLGLSRLGHARFGDDDEAFDAFRSRNVDHTRDALIAATAQYEQCALVSNDRRLTNRARERGVDAMTPGELLKELGFDA